LPSLYLIRHGRTAWNADRRIQGHLDVPLDDEGRRQAEALAAALADVPLKALYASPLQRAVETAAAIAALHDGLPLQLDQRLMERHWGAYEGLRREDAAQAHVAAERELRGDPVHASAPGGESFLELHTRVGAALRDIAAKESGRVAIVCHGGTIVAGLMGLLGIEGWPRVRFVIENASVTLLDVARDGGVVTHYVNRRDHLAQ